MFTLRDLLRLVLLGLASSALLSLITRYRDRRRSWWSGYVPRGQARCGIVERVGPYPKGRRVRVGRWS